MKIFFRVDSSFTIGAGHLKRCLNIAKIYKRNKITFISKKLNGNLNHLIADKKYSLVEINSKSKTENKSDFQKVKKIIEKYNQQKILIADSYFINLGWEKKIKKIVDKLIIIDDLQRNHSADFLINSNWYFDKNEKYLSKYKNCNNILFGPNYSLIETPKKKVKLKEYTIFFGGSDDKGVTFKVTKILSNLTKRNINVVLLNKKIIYIEKFKNEFKNYTNIKILINLKSIVKILQKTKIFIGSGGSTTWLRSYLGINSIITNLSFDQKDFSIQLHNANCQTYLNKKNITNPIILKKTISKISKKEKIIKKNFSNLVDGYGIKRIQLLLNKKKRMINLKEVNKDNIGFLYFLKNQKDIFISAFSQNKISFNDHILWFKKVNSDNNIKFFTICIQDVPIGSLRFNFIKNLSYIDIAIDKNFTNFGYASKALHYGIKKIKKKMLKYS